MTKNKNIAVKQPKGTFRPMWPQKVIIDERGLQTLAAEIDLLGAQRVFLITSPSLVARTPLFEQVKEILGDRLKGQCPSYPSTVDIGGG